MWLVDAPCFGRPVRVAWRKRSWVWRSIAPLLEAMAADPARFVGVTTLGVDEHIWHHVHEMDRGPRASNFTAGSPPASATATTTASACC